jgi:mono/diheme cytochrome c family protein
MKDDQPPSKIIIVAILALVVAGAGAWFLQDRPKPVPAAPNAQVQIVIPDFTPAAQSGNIAFHTNCAECHGANATGTEQGPPLVHDIYQPGHHNDASFRRARERGVKAHHWPFGDMPPQPQVTNDEITDIITYIRELQRANGIVEHAMGMKMKM